MNGETIVIKLGGNAMNNSELESAFAEDIVQLHESGKRVVLVHGGGPQVSEMLGRLDVVSEFRGGHRVTTEEVRDIARMVLTGKVQREIVNEINKISPIAVGLSGEDAHLFVMTRRAVVVGGVETDLGLVGDIERVNVQFLRLLMDNGLAPVISSLGPGENGDVYNINADCAAGSIAGALKADRLLVLTDVAGLYANWPSTDRLIDTLTADQLLEMIPTLSEGMIPKMEACVAALKDGARTAHVIDGRVPHIVHEALNGSPIGTKVTYR